MHAHDTKDATMAQPEAAPKVQSFPPDVEYRRPTPAERSAGAAKHAPTVRVDFPVRDQWCRHRPSYDVIDAATNQRLRFCPNCGQARRLFVSPDATVRLTRAEQV